MLNLAAVFWLPNTSKTSPPRGEKLFHVGMSMGPNVRAAVKRPAGDVSTGMPVARCSYLAP
jgi:hypothetical protein